MNIAIFDSVRGVKHDHKRLSVQVYAELRAARAGRRRDRNSSGSGSSTTSAFSPWSPASSSESSSAPSARQATSDGGGSQSSVKKRKFTAPNQVMTLLIKYLLQLASLKYSRYCFSITTKTESGQNWQPLSLAITVSPLKKG